MLSTLRTGAMAALIALPAMAEPALDAETRAAILAPVDAIAEGADAHDWARVETAFAPEITTDYTSLFGGTPVAQPAADLIAQWAGFLPGFDATHHMLANRQIVSAGDGHTEATADFTAVHRIGTDLWILAGHYRYNLVQTDGSWRVSALTMTAGPEQGDRGLIARAAARMAGEDQRAAVTAFYDHLAAKRMEAFFALMTEDAVQEMPYAPPGFPGLVEGRDGIEALFAGFPDATGAVRFDGLVIHETADPDRLIAEVAGHIEFLGAPEPYRQRYITVFEFSDGRIARIREYFDPLPFAAATGLGRFVPD